MSQITMAGRAPGSGAVSPAAWVALGLALIGALGLGFGQSPRIAALSVVGGAFGLVLYHAAFGFTSAWRNFIRDGRGRGLRAQMVMLAIAVALFFPALAAGSLFGQEVSGFVSPVGTSVLVGAFIFGIGMQLGGGCASGTLYTAGGGNARMLITLAFFIIGSLLATIHFDWWMALPAFEPVSVVYSVGAPLGIILSFAVFAAILSLFAAFAVFLPDFLFFLSIPAAFSTVAWTSPSSSSGETFRIVTFAFSKRKPTTLSSKIGATSRCRPSEFFL